MTRTLRIKHFGWFGLCPIYIDDAHAEVPNIVVYRRWLELWFDANLVLMGVIFWLGRVLFKGNSVAGFLVTHEYDPPIIIEASRL